MVQGYQIIPIPSFIDQRGGLSVVELGKELPFSVKRVYWLYDIQMIRGSHCHKQLKQFLFCTQGFIDIILDDGSEKVTITLTRNSQGLLIEKPLWREVCNFHNNPTLIVLASEVYREEDYITCYKAFKKWKLPSST
jgi:dTDP-4-dehydrorhamnose 3,5-epimerase-like enzyme